MLSGNRSKRIEERQIWIELADLFNKWAGEHRVLYYALSKITGNEFNRTCASLKRDANQQIQHALAANNQVGSNCQDRNSGNNFPGNSMTNHGRGAGYYTHDCLRSYNSPCSDHTTAKPPKSFWKKILKH